MRRDEAFIPVNGSPSAWGTDCYLNSNSRSAWPPAGLIGGPASYNTAPPPRVLPRGRGQMATPRQPVWQPQITVNARTDESPEHIAHAVNRHLHMRSCSSQVAIGCFY